MSENYCLECLASALISMLQKPFRPCPAHQSLEIYVKLLNGNTKTFHYLPWETIGSLAERIHELTKIPTCEIRLIYAGKDLQLQRTFQEYNIPTTATIHMLIRLVCQICSKRQMEDVTSTQIKRQRI